MSLFKLAKTILNPNIHIWTSHLVTILFTILVAAAVSFWIVVNEQGLHFVIANTEEHYRLLFERSLAGAYRTAWDGRILDHLTATLRIRQREFASAVHTMG